MNQGNKSSTQPTAVGVTEVYPGEAYICGDDIVYDLVPFRSYRPLRPDGLQILPPHGPRRVRVQGLHPHFLRTSKSLSHRV